MWTVLACCCLGVPPTPESHAAAAIVHLEASVPWEDWYYTRFLSYAAVPEVDLPKYQHWQKWWLPQIAFAQRPEPPREVPGTDGRLFALDLRDYNWNGPAWEAVALREQYTRVPLIPASLGDRLRRIAGYRGADKTAVITMIRGDWFMRETQETLRSPAYYDLLFAKDRFTGVRRKISRNVQHAGGDFHYPDGRITPSVPAGVYGIEYWESTDIKFVDFPKDEADWDKAFGLDKTKEFFRAQRIDLRNGAIVAGNNDDPKSGSVVSNNGRFLELIDGPVGWAGATYDLADYSKTDFLEHGPKLIFGEAKFDGGELLAQLPSGGLACLLINGQGKRVELAPTNIVRDVEGHPRTADVRTPFSCFGCHGPSNGFLRPKNLVDDQRKAGVKTRFADRDQRNAYENFYLDWDGKIPGWQGRFVALLKRTTGWSGAKMVEIQTHLREAYDRPVTPAQAAIELGVPLETMKLRFAKYSPRVRLNLLVQGEPVPRRLWESGLFQEAVLTSRLPP